MEIKNRRLCKGKPFYALSNVHGSLQIIQQKEFTENLPPKDNGNAKLINIYTVYVFQRTF